jgi:AcrR family transcriptional regulator
MRDAAIELVATDGVDALTARAVAEAAGVSAGLVIHHFGSMDGLRAACDEHIAAAIREQKSSVLRSGPGLDVMAMLRDARTARLVGYVAAVLAEDSPAVSGLVDDLVADAEQYLDEGVRSGMLRHSSDPRGRAVVLTLWGLSTLVMHRHVHRLLGVDLTDPDLDPTTALVPYLRPVLELFSAGLYTEAMATSLEPILGPAEGED